MIMLTKKRKYAEITMILRSYTVESRYRLDSLYSPPPELGKSVRMPIFESLSGRNSACFWKLLMWLPHFLKALFFAVAQPYQLWISTMLDQLGGNTEKVLQSFVVPLEARHGTPRICRNSLGISRGRAGVPVALKDSKF